MSIPRRLRQDVHKSPRLPGLSFPSSYRDSTFLSIFAVPNNATNLVKNHFGTEEIDLKETLLRDILVFQLRDLRCYLHIYLLQFYNNLPCKHI